jgi:hypothetical protein
MSCVLYSRCIISYLNAQLAMSCVLYSRCIISYLGCQTIGAAPMSYIRHGHFVSLLTSQTKDYKIGMCCFFANHTTLKSRDKDWLDLCVVFSLYYIISECPTRHVLCVVFPLYYIIFECSTAMSCVLNLPHSYFAGFKENVFELSY